jgi:hypothetical protein
MFSSGRLSFEKENTYSSECRTGIYDMTDASRVSSVMRFYVQVMLHYF